MTAARADFNAGAKRIVSDLAGGVGRGRLRRGRRPRGAPDLVATAKRSYRRT